LRASDCGGRRGKARLCGGLAVTAKGGTKSPPDKANGLSRTVFPGKGAERRGAKPREPVQIRPAVMIFAC